MEKTALQLFIDRFRNRIADGGAVLLIIDALMPALADKAKENELILLRARAKQANSELITGVCSQAEFMQHNIRHQAALLSFLDSLSPHHLHPNYLEDKEEPSSAHRSGQLFYRIPNLMKLGKPVRCSVRIALSKAELLNGLEAQEGDQLRDLQIVSDTMQVELADPYEEHFKIRARNSPEQAVFEKGYTEWHFMVTSMVAGEHPLELRVSVIALLNNKEVRREIILEETVSVTTEVSLQTIFPRPAWQEAETPALQFCATPASRAAGGFFYKIAQSGAVAAASMLLLFAAWVFFPKSSDKNHYGGIEEPPTETAIDSAAVEGILVNGRFEEDSVVGKEEEEPQSRQRAVSPERLALETQRAAMEEQEKRLAEARPHKNKSSGKFGNTDIGGNTNSGNLPTNPQIPNHKSGSGTANTGTANTKSNNTQSDKVRISIGGGLSARKLKPKPLFDKNFNNSGTVVLLLCVGNSGKVLSYKYTLKGSTTNDRELITAAMEAAKSFEFEPIDLPGKECGTVSFQFKLQ